MNERPRATLRLLLIALVIVNAVLLAYIVLTPDRAAETSRRIAALQINPGRIRVVGAASRGPQGSTSAKAERTASSTACIEWAPLDAADIPKAQAALTDLRLAERPIQRAVTGAAGGKRYALYIREPNEKLVAQIAAIQR